ncbi:hypothetical protein Ctob_016289 [Chrysochromulina tobinii]|uniref:Uncharacterized protein n=1 Tax=Chrysochromulina tobinii TaxID=1460289 RepID=A0A0M0K5N6_9EUKA|nr:hypothetical protein Ctob_016289 [Chrysochromulina tobinii]|eukprot:KOO33698.1 hypothetical protein Ctob_016289 [Chrysochromulina sp. CCMP291]
MLYPTLAAIRGANYLTLMSDKEIRSVVTEMEIDAKEFDAADDDDEPEDDENGEDEVEELVVAEAELGGQMEGVEGVEGAEAVEGLSTTWSMLCS